MSFLSDQLLGFIRRHLSIQRRVKLGIALRHRRQAYQLLDGNGLEIGALHNPAAIPARCSITYADAITTQEASANFPELNANELVPVSIIVDLDKTGLTTVQDESFDFAILNHVIEHVANPIAVVSELFRVVRKGGLVVISAPDKYFTYDKPRSLTPFSHLRDEYVANVTAVGDDHYRELVLATLKPHLAKNETLVQEKMAEYRLRREHAHVWDSLSFRSFMLQALDFLDIQAELEWESFGAQNRLEYFSVWKKR